jgi:hypothetical protein
MRGSQNGAGRKKTGSVKTSEGAILAGRRVGLRKAFHGLCNIFNTRHLVASPAVARDRLRDVDPMRGADSDNARSSRSAAQVSGMLVASLIAPFAPGQCADRRFCNLP